MTSPKDVSLVAPLRVSIKDKLLQAGQINSTANGIPCADSGNSPDVPLTTACNGRCEMYDLSREEDRKSYADLCAKLMTPDVTTCQKLWEDRVTMPDGRLVVYITYTELVMLSADLLQQ